MPESIPLTYPQFEEESQNLQGLVERALIQVLWDDPRLHSARLRLFLTSFCSVCILQMMFPNVTTKVHFRRFHTSLTRHLSTLPRTWSGTF